MTVRLFGLIRRYVASRTTGQWVGAVVLAQFALIVGGIVVGEWRYQSGKTITIPIALVDRFSPIRGGSLEFIPVPFRHAFKSTLPISPGDIVIVSPVDAGLTQWVILADPPSHNKPYFYVKVVSANDRYFFLEPPFQRIKLRESDQLWLSTYLNRPVYAQQLAIRVRYNGAMAMVSDLKANGRVISVR